MKKLLLGALLLAGAFATAFAQESKTSESTAGIFGTDVDDFMDVNSWSNVNPEKLFSFLGVSPDIEGKNGAFDFGFAKNFGSVYWGTYFYGDFGGYSKTTFKSDGDKVKISKSATQDDDTGTDDKTLWKFDNLIGIGSLGIKLGFIYNNIGTTKYRDSESSDNDEISDKSAWELSGSVGINLDKLTPHFGLAFAKNNPFYSDSGLMDSITNDLEINNLARGKTAGKEYDSTYSYFKLWGGTGIDLSKSEETEQSLNLDADLAILIKGDDADDIKLTTLGFVPEYSVTHAASEKLSLGASFGLPFGFAFGDLKYFELTPEIKGGLSYKATEKLTLNMGIALSLISFTWDKRDDEGIDLNNDGVDDAVGSMSIFEVNGDDAEVTFSTGFNFAFTEKVSLDFNWDVIAGIFGNDFNSDFNEGKTESAFWGNMNSFFYSKFGFIVVVKL